MIEVQRKPATSIDTVDFKDLPFGKVFSDHMLVCDYVDGQWGDVRIMPYEDVKFPLSLHALHYGQAAFEGMKAYRMMDGGVGLFRPEMNFHRLNRSARRLCMPEVPEEVFMKGLEELVRIDCKWVPKEEGTSLYIRPFLFSSSSFIAARPSEKYTFAIITSPVGPYYSGTVKVRVEQEYTRSAAGGIGFTKAAGNYGGAFFPTREAQNEGYTQILWTDHRDHRFIEESGTMNVMFRIGNTFRTPPLSDRILAGITRDSILTLLRSWNEVVEERPITVDELRYSAEQGYLQEAFGMGTAAVVSPITTIGFKDKEYDLVLDESGYGQRIKKALGDIRSGAVADRWGWMQVLEGLN